MKKLLLSVTIVASLAIIVVSCNTNPNSMIPVSNSDTVGLAEFREWKALEAQALLAQQKAASNVATKKKASSKNYQMNTASTNEAKVAKKKGWSKSAKYGVIGAAGGGVLGAVINKKSPVKGAVIGAIVLGGGGYIFGRSRDKKDGRF